MKISVIVPTYNKSEDFINDCIDSLIKQTLRKEYFDITIVDDHSTQKETIDAINNIKNRHPFIKTIRNKRNLGLNETRKVGINNTDSDYVFFIDADDLLTRDALESLWIKAKETRADMITSLMYRYNGTSKSYNLVDRFYTHLPDNPIEALKIFLSAEFSFSMCGSLLKREILNHDILNIEEDKNLFHEDMTTTARILFNKPTTSHIKKHIYYYRWNENSITSKVSINHIDGIFHAFKDWIKLASKIKLSKELMPYITYGISTLCNLWVLRSILKPSKNTTTLELLNHINNKSKELPITFIIGSHKGLKILKTLDSRSDFSEKNFQTIKEKYKLGSPSISYNPDSQLDICIKPSKLAIELSNKIVFICQVDYHVKTAAFYIENLRNKYSNLVILDNSALAEKGTRRSHSDVITKLKQEEYILTNRLPLYADSLCTAELIITFNDFNDGIRDALEYRYLHKKPTACLIEGVNDFLRLDFNFPVYHSYRSCETVLLSGSNDAQYFKDRETYIIGLPIVEKLMLEEVSLLDLNKKTAILNSNFAYGSLENKRDEYIQSAKEVFEELGWKWEITKHPADRGDFSGLPVSEKSIYELIKSCTVFVSKFSTGIIEALAAGKPVIYYNCHQEKNPKYKESLGAFYTANNKEELIQSLKQLEIDISVGKDFRKQAIPFLKEHAGYSEKVRSYERLDKFIELNKVYA